MGESAKVMTIRLHVEEDGSATIERVGESTDKFGASATKAAQGESLLTIAMRDAAAAADRASASSLRAAAAVATQGNAAKVGAREHVAFWSTTDRLKDAIDALNAKQAQNAAAAERGSAASQRWKSATAEAARVATGLGEVLNTQVNPQLLTYASAAAAAGLAIGTYLVKRGLEQNSVMEQTRLGMAALVGGLAVVTDANGRVLEGQERWNASLQISEQLQARLKVAALATTANYKDLVQVMQHGLGPMINAGITDPAKIVQLVQAIAQTGGALGIPGERLGQEIKALLRGERGPDNEIANQLLGDMSKAKFDELVKSGKVFDFLIDKMKAFQRAGTEAANTLSGAWSNFQDAIDQALGEGTTGATTALTAALQDLTAQIVTFDGEGRAVFNPQFIAGVNDLGKALGFFAGSVVLVTEKIPAWIEKMQRFKIYFAGGLGAAAALKDIKQAEEQLRLYRELMAEQDRSGLVDRGRAFLTDRRPGRQMPAFTTTRSKRAGDLLAIDEQTFADVGAVAKKYDFSSGSAKGQHLAKFYRDLLTGYVKDGKLSILELREADDKMAAEASKIVGGPKLKPPPKSTELTASLQSQFNEYKLLIENFRRMAEATGNPFEAKLAAIDHQEAEALAKVDAARKKFKDLGRNFDADVKAIQAAADADRTKVERERAEMTRGYRDTMRQHADAANFGIGSDPIARQRAELERQKQAALDAQRKQIIAGAAITPIEALRGQAEIIAAFDTQIALLYHEKVDLPVKAMAKENQSQIESDRIEQIRDGIERELAQRLKANNDWYEQEKLAHVGEAEYLSALELQKQKRDQLALDQAQRRRDREVLATREWARQVAAELTDEIGRVPQLVTNAWKQSRQNLTSAFEGFFTSLRDGNASLGESVNNLSKSLGSSWSHVFSSILTNGQSVTAQLKDVWSHLNAIGGNPMIGSGGSGLLDGGLAGAGLGSFVGGIFQSPSNHAGIGGTIGGGLGAIVSTVAGFGPAIGAAIGTALGTVVGSMIQTGKDSIKVAISNISLANLGTPGQPTMVNERRSEYGFGDGSYIRVDEEGVSAQSRTDIAIQIRRKVKETMKSWQDIIDLIPAELRAQLADIRPTLNLDGGTETKDISDENALGSLSDFFGDKLPKAGFQAYHDAIEKALGLLGVQNTQVQADFAYWGTLQGQELHDAVQRYFKAVLDANDLRTKLSAPIETRVQTARQQMDATPISHLQDLNSQIALTVGSMSKLKDPEDLVAAQEHLNDLSRQYYSESIAAATEALSIQRQLREANTSLREQIQLAGMGSQDKQNYYYAQLAGLRDDLVHTTDPKKIAEIETRMNNYIQAAFGLAPDDAENRKRLTAILEDINSIRDANIDIAITKDIAAEDQKAATMLQEAAKALFGAAEAMKPPTDDKDKDKDKDKGDPEDPRKHPRKIVNGEDPAAGDIEANRHRDIVSRLDVIPVAIDRMSDRFQESIASLRHLQAWDEVPDGKTVAVVDDNGMAAGAGGRQSTELAAVLRELTAALKTLGIKVTLEQVGDLGAWLEQFGINILVTSVNETVKAIRDHPEIILPVSG